MAMSALPSRLKLVDRDDFIVQCCKGCHVIHLGCTDSPLHIAHQKVGRLLHQKLVGEASYLCGVDIDHDALSWLERNVGGDEFQHGSIEDRSFMLALKKKNVDVILLTDVLEHLSNPLIALQNIRAIAAEHSKFIVSVPNAYNLKGFLRVPLGYEIIHPDHVAFHSFYTLTNLVRRAGWQPESYFTYLGGGIGPAAWAANRVLRFFPAWAEGIGLIAKPGSTE